MSNSKNDQEAELNRITNEIITTKRENFRVEIRKQVINDIFREKRQKFIEDFKYTDSIEQGSFDYVSIFSFKTLKNFFFLICSLFSEGYLEPKI